MPRGRVVIRKVSVTAVRVTFPVRWVPSHLFQENEVNNDGSEHLCRGRRTM